MDFLPFAKNMSKNIGKTVIKNLSAKYGQKTSWSRYLIKLLFDQSILLDQSTTDALITASKRVIQKTAEATGNLISKKIPDKVQRQLQMKQKILDLISKYQYIYIYIYIYI